jgi:hypothetical protein
MAIATTIGLGSNAELYITIGTSLLYRITPMLDLQDFQARESFRYQGVQGVDNRAPEGPCHMDLSGWDYRQCRDFPVVGMVDFQEVQSSHPPPRLVYNQQVIIAIAGTNHDQMFQVSEDT